MYNSGNNIVAQISTSGSDGFLKLNKLDGSPSIYLQADQVSQIKDGLELGGTAQTIQTVNLQLSQAQIQALNTTPIEIVAAPGAGKYIQIMSASAFLDHNGTTYSGASGDIQLNIGSNIFITSGTNIITQTSDSVVPILGVNQYISLNTAMNITSSNDFTGAGGTLDVYVQYAIIDTA